MFLKFYGRHQLKPEINMPKDISAFFPATNIKILKFTNLSRAASRVWTCEQPEFRLWWMKPCSNEKHFTTAPQTDYCIENWQQYKKRLKLKVRNF